MATITPTAANVRVGVGSSIGVGVAGEAISQFEFLYRDGTDANKYKLADNTTEPKASVVAVAVTNAAIDGSVAFIPVVNGVVESTSSLWTLGMVYVASDTPGKLMDAADSVTGDFVTVVGVAESATRLRMVRNDPLEV